MDIYGIVIYYIKLNKYSTMSTDSFISVFLPINTPPFIEETPPYKMYKFEELFSIINSEKYADYLDLYDFTIKTILHYPFLIFPICETTNLTYESWFYWINKHHTNPKLLPNISAVYLPNIYTFHLIESAISLCNKIKSILLINEPDFYDYILSTDI